MSVLSLPKGMLLKLGTFLHLRMNLQTHPKAWKHGLIKTIFGQNFRKIQPKVSAV